jgi:hypothetical protein
VVPLSYSIAEASGGYGGLCYVGVVAYAVVGTMAAVVVGMVAPGVSYIGAIAWLRVQHCLHDVLESLRAPGDVGGAAYWRTDRVRLRGIGLRSILLILPIQV